MKSTALRRLAACAILAFALGVSGQAQAPVVTNLGPGCGNPPPTLTVTAPTIGGVATFDFLSSVPNAMVLVGISDPIPAPYPSVLGCPLYLNLATLQVLTPGNTSPTGSFQFNFPIPLSATLGVSKHVQFLVWAAEGDSLSNGLALTAGLPPTPCRVTESSIGSNFNGTSIALGRTIWFNAILKATGIPSTGGIVQFGGSTIEFIASGVPYVVSVPPSLILYDPAATTAETQFDVGAGEWRTTVPASYSGNVFLSGVGFPVNPALPGGINPVTWRGSFASSAPGVGFQWKWAAAVYTTFSTDPNAVGAKPVDGSGLSIYANSDHAGTPEAFKDFVIGGARGGGGSNFTGSYSGTTSAACQ